MFDESTEALPGSPHQRMLDFLAESDEIADNFTDEDPDWNAMISGFSRVLENEDASSLTPQGR
ncbi:hypothetical protein OG787_20625 [Streptomyces sp. NBC_00075]|uniref:hypothetical protein n=1 Tax=Streptomyces sp. NBC_00075 TaxID=2975641 RepID=UPI0032432A1C